MPKVTQQYRAAQRERILSAARRCFLRDGFHATSVHTVLADAGVSAGAFYRYFASKDDVILAIAEENLRDVMTLIHQAATQRRGRSAGDVIAELAEAVRARHEADGEAGIAVLVWAEALRNPVLAERFGCLLASMRADLAAVVGAAHPSVAAVLSSILPGYVLLLALLGPAAVQEVPDAVRALW